MPNRLHAHAELRRDPTRSVTLRKRFAQEAAGRFSRIIRDLRESIVDNDAFGLATNEVARPGQFAFDSDARKVAAFGRWIDRQLMDNILTVPDVEGIDMRVHWMGQYLASAYDKGVRRAQAEMRRRGIDFAQSAAEAAGEIRAINRPAHARRVGSIYVRAFQELKGISDATAQHVTRELTDGLARGDGTREIARSLRNRIDAVGKHRSRLLARTEVIRAHAQASLEEYRQAGLEGVSAQVEFATAGDSRVCERCDGLEGRVFSLDEAQNIIPVHPACRCTWLPAIE